jgi:hypothetical protein
MQEENVLRKEGRDRMEKGDRGLGSSYQSSAWKLITGGWVGSDEVDYRTRGKTNLRGWTFLYESRLS